MLVINVAVTSDPNMSRCAKITKLRNQWIVFYVNVTFNIFLQLNSPYSNSCPKWLAKPLNPITNNPIKVFFIPTRTPGASVS